LVSFSFFLIGVFFRLSCRGWLVALVAGTSTSQPDFSFFTVSLVLTLAGGTDDAINETADLLFQYIRLVQAAYGVFVMIIVLFFFFCFFLLSSSFFFFFFFFLLLLLLTFRNLEPYYNELKSLSELNFTFKEKERPQDYVVSLANAAHYYPLKDVLVCMMLFYVFILDCFSLYTFFAPADDNSLASSLLFEWSPEGVNEVLGTLSQFSVQFILC
jgi:hypothetical protein